MMRIAVLAVIGATIRTQPEPTGWDQRLASLSPDEPSAYLSLAEEIIDLGRVEEVPLARELLALAFELDRLDGGGSEVAASSCLALASIEPSGAARRWYLALAGSVDRRYAETDWTAAAAVAAGEQTALAAATALGYARAGEGSRAREIVRDGAVLGLITEFERVMSTVGSTGAVFRFQRALEDWPCPECGNQRVIAKPSNEGVQHRLCYTCRGNPGPELSTQDLAGQLRFESILLRGIQRSWGAQITADQGAPLRDPEAEELARTIGVSADRPLWRDGAWAAP